MNAGQKLLKNLFPPKKFTVEIQEQEFSFVPCGIQSLSNAKKLSHTLFSSLAILLSDSDNMNTVTQRTLGEVTEVTSEPPSADLYEAINKRRTEAFSAISDLLCDASARADLNKIIANSLRTDSNFEDYSPADILNFLDNLDIPTYIEFLKGTALANAKAAGPFFERIFDSIETTLKKRGLDIQDQQKSEPKKGTKKKV